MTTDTLKPKHHLFIYERREILILGLLGATVALFTFTLGVHMGKKVAVHVAVSNPPAVTPVDEVTDKIPARADLSEQAAGVQTAVEDTVNQELHDEVAKTGIHLKTLRQVDLPESAQSKNAGATHLEVKAPLQAQAAVGHFYSLQVGSHPDEESAQKQLESLRAQNLEPFLKSVELSGKGKWYRVYVGNYPTKSAAEQAGSQYHSSQAINSFIVAKISD